MRDPVGSEADAFHILAGSAVLIPASLALVSLVLGAVFWEVGTNDPDRRPPLSEAVSQAPPRERASAPRVLVAANRTRT